MKTENQNLHPRRSLAGEVLAAVLLALGVATTHNILQAESTAPAIDSLTPDSAMVGTAVTIRGVNFGPSIGALQGTSGASFNGVWGQPTYWSNTEIQVPVPAGAPSGLVVVTVGGRESNGVAFTVERPAPVIEAVNPGFGPEGTPVAISGTSLGPAIEASQKWSGVSFNGVWASASAWSDTEIRVAVPAGVSSGLIVVTVGEQSSNGSAFTVTEDKRVTWVAVASVRDEESGPAIRKMKPDLGQAGASVKVKGSNFGASQGTSTVTFNGRGTSPSRWSDTKIRVAVPAGATTGPVVVTVDGKASEGVPFTVTETGGSAPAIKKVKPETGEPGIWVKVKGSNFGAVQGTSAVAFNGVAATPDSWSDTKIRVAIPAGATTGDVVVTVGGQASNGVRFTVTGEPPYIRKLKPDSGSVGTWVKVKGSNFRAVQGTSTVAFNGVAATPDSWSDTKIRVQAPSGATTGPVVVTVDGKASNGVEFTYR